MIQAQKRFRIVAVLTFAVSAGLFLVGVRVLWAEDIFDPVEQNSIPQSAVASDRESDHVTDVAREMLRLQEQQGGSVVRDRFELQDAPQPIQLPPQEFQRPHRRIAPDTTLLTWPEDSRAAAERAAHSRHELKDLSSRTKIAELREAAWQLDTTAYRLEKLDLYDQADALRGVANRLRSDARRMKQEASMSAVDQLRYERPSNESQRQRRQ